MFKKVIVCMIGLVILSGMTMGEEKFPFSLKVKYEISSTENQMTEPAVIECWKSPYDTLWWTKRTMEALNKKSFHKFYLEASYSFINRFEIYGKIGVLTTKSMFQNPATSWSTGYGDKILAQDQPQISENDIQGTGKGILAGGGINLSILKKNDFEINLDLGYLCQWVNTEIMIEEEHVRYNYFHKEKVNSGWDKEIKVEKVKIQEFRIALPISQKKDNLTITAGPELIWIKNEYQGRYLLESFSTFSIHTEWNDRDEIKKEFEFKTQNVKKLGGFLKVEYRFNKNVGIAFETAVGAKKGFVCNWTFYF